MITGAMAKARLANARGDARGVLSALEPVLQLQTRDAVDEPGFWPWQDLYAEALVDVGSVAEADEFLRPHEARAAERRRPSSVARLARARAKVEATAGRPAEAEAAYGKALDELGHVSMPFELALVELAFGQFLRRSGRRKEAAGHLTAAEGRFRALGARPYLERTRTELDNCGHPQNGRNSFRGVGLTSQELLVARLVADGRSNREVAAELVVSVKTIEFHLSNAYHKLGVTSRRQLPGRLAELSEG
jgi:DNA-binding CsgD family transcriptional regulator